MADLLKDFLRRDCNETVHQTLLAEIGKYGPAKADVVRDFNFNRFNVHLDFQNGNVRLDDELDTSEQGSCSISLSDFVAALNREKPEP